MFVDHIASYYAWRLQYQPMGAVRSKLLEAINQYFPEDVTTKATMITSKPLPSTYEMFITIGFSNGEFVIGADGEHPACATLWADITAGMEGWTIDTVYLGSQGGREESGHQLSGAIAETAKHALLENDAFNAWANGRCRGFDDNAADDRGQGTRDFFAGLSDHLEQVRRTA